MNEDRKLAEAEYFYGQMLAVQQNQEHFGFNFVLPHLICGQGAC